MTSRLVSRNNTLVPTGITKLTRCDDRLSNAIFVIGWVVVFPPPLLTSHVDDHLRVARLVQIKHGAESEYTNYSQNECRNNCQRDFKRWISVTLFWNWLTSVTKLNHAVDNGYGDDYPDNSGNGKNWFLQSVNFLSVRTFWLEGVLRCIATRNSQEKLCLLFRG